MVAHFKHQALGHPLEDEWSLSKRNYTCRVTFWIAKIERHGSSTAAVVDRIRQVLVERTRGREQKVLEIQLPCTFFFFSLETNCDSLIVLALRTYPCTTAGKEDVASQRSSFFALECSAVFSIARATFVV
jgi:hypothetical protein